MTETEQRAEFSIVPLQKLYDAAQKALARDLSGLREAIDSADENYQFVQENLGTIASAHSEYANDDLEIDDNPLVSVTNRGVWVNAWVWVGK